MCKFFGIAMFCVVLFLGITHAESLKLIAEEDVPKSVRDLYDGFDPDKEPLEVKVLKEFEQDRVIIQMLTFTVGKFKGVKSRISGFYGYPRDAKVRVPALIQLHGGGQRAEIRSVKYAAQNGYACLALNWGGRPLEGSEGLEGTDWGAVDATQKGHNSHYGSLMPDQLTIDQFESPRNSNWFLIVLAGMRGVSFLQSQDKVDADKIGVFGHSMGGKLTVMLTGADNRIKAASPSCGGCGAAPKPIRQWASSGVRPLRSPLYHQTIDDAQYLKEIKVPILYLGPTNDFNGILDVMYANWRNLRSKNVAYSVTPHMNHRSIPEHAISSILFFNDHLKGKFKFPSTPKLQVQTKGTGKMAVAKILPEMGRLVEKVEVLYSNDPHILTRFWRTEGAEKVNGHWEANVPLLGSMKPVHVLANIYYRLETEVEFYPSKRNVPNTFGVSTEMKTFRPEPGNAKMRAPVRVIESNFDSYEDWYRLEWNNPNWWSAYTRKIKDPMHIAPVGSNLVIDVKSEKGGAIFFEIKDNYWNAFPKKPKGNYYARVDFEGSSDWQKISVSLGDFKPMDDRTTSPLRSWERVTELGIRGRVAVVRDGKRVELPEHASKYRWPEPREFKNLRWEGGKYLSP